MFYSGLLTERKDVDVRETAALRQQRRMKQAVQFNHKDSADLLPLDGLKKLGTSKDTQPHSILQRRLMETNMSRLRHNRGTGSQKNDLSVQTNKLNQMKLDGVPQTEEEDLIVVCCQCAGKELQAVVDTGCQRNIISSACLERLGLKEHMKSHKAENEKIPLPQHVKVIGHLEHLPLTMGTVHVDCSVVVVAEGDEKSFSLGLQTLKFLKCVINLEKQNLILGKTAKEEIPFVSNVSAHEENYFLGHILMAATCAPGSVLCHTAGSLGSVRGKALLMHEENIALALEKGKYCVVESEDFSTDNFTFLELQLDCSLMKELVRSLGQLQTLIYHAGNLANDVQMDI